MAVGRRRDCTRPGRRRTRARDARETGYYLGRGFANIIKSVDPTRIYVGGEITGALDLCSSAVREAMREHALTREVGETEIRVVRLTEYPRLRGAAALMLTPAFAAPTVA
jgi:predicted NBD/HSP70 family sugar kinase